MSVPTFTEGKIPITTTKGEVEVDAHFFHWNGLTLAITPNIRLQEGDALKDFYFLDYGVTHPETGLKFPHVSGADVQTTYEEFIAEVPIMEASIETRHGKTLKEFLENAAKNKQSSVVAAKRKHEREKRQ